MQNHDKDVPTLKHLRESAGLTQEELARKLNKSTRIITDWENLRRLPRIDNAADIAKALNVSLNTLYKSFRIDVSDLPNDSET